jgi:hypothetical protein
MLATERLIELANFPHHKHVGRRADLQPSSETRLEEVLAIVFGNR